MLQITTHYQSRSALPSRSRFMAGFIFLALPGLAFAQDRVGSYRFAKFSPI